MLRKAAVVYGIRIISGLSGPVMVLIFGRLYATSGLSELALFLLFFNLLVVHIAWGHNVRVIDQINICKSANNLGIVLIQIVLNSSIIFPFVYLLLSEFNLWNYGLLGALPIALAMVVSSSFVAQGAAIKAVAVHEAVRALLPLVLAVVIFQIDSKISSSSLIAFSYFGLFVIIPVIFRMSFRSVRHLGFCVKAAGNSWWSDQRRCVLIVLPQILFVVVAQADRLLIEILGTKADLAAYFSAQTTLSALVVAIQALIGVFTPKISAVAFCKTGSLAKESKIILFASVVVAALSVPASAIYFRLLDVDFNSSLQIYGLLVGSVLFSLIFGVGFQALQFFDAKKPYFAITTVCLLIQLFTIVTFFDVIGIYAAALAFGLYTITSSLLAWRFWLKQGVIVAPRWGNA